MPLILSLKMYAPICCQDVECKSAQLELVQALSLVQLPESSVEGFQDWVLHRLFSVPLIYSCPLADISRIYVDVTDNEVSIMEKYTCIYSIPCTT